MTKQNYQQRKKNQKMIKEKERNIIKNETKKLNPKKKHTYKILNRCRFGQHGNIGFTNVIVLLMTGY